MTDRRAAWIAANPERAREAVRRWKQANRDRVKEYNRVWREANRSRLRKPSTPKSADAAREAARAWYKNNTDAAREAARAWHKNNRGKSNELKARRRAAQLQRTPIWLSAEHRRNIQDIYQTAARMTRLTGVPHHVDHVVPLRGRNVSGLHVPWNLQILTASENLSKSRRVQSEGHPGGLYFVAPG